MEVTPTKNTPSNLGSRDFKALYAAFVSIILRNLRARGIILPHVFPESWPFSDTGVIHLHVRKWRAFLADPSMMNATHPTAMNHLYKTMKSPVGELKLVASDNGLSAILWENDDPHRVPLGDASEAPDHPLLLETERQLNDYFAGKLRKFSVKLDFSGTAFQKQVWHALTTIPFGETRSYGEIARQIGNPKSVRAVGAANGRNPISIIAPCHRVIGANGKLTGFAGGLEAKAFLLGLEADADLFTGK